MKVLHVVRPDAPQHPGGDLVHAERAGAALRERGIDVTLVAAATPEARGYDAAHVFGIFEPDVARAQIAAIRATKTPLALSPIWLDLRAFFALAPRVEHALAARTVRETERRLARLHAEAAQLPWRGRTAAAAGRRLDVQRALAREAGVLLPASEVEAHLLGERLGLHDIPLVVAPLGVDVLPAGERARIRSGVLCVGRIEPKKNQAALLYALRDLDVDVTIIGRAHDEAYLALCRKHATARTRFIEHLPFAEVVEAMRAAAVHAHPSWLESPGLSSLEAAACGAQLVTGNRGCEREYFGAEIEYADPADPATIRAAVERALARPPREAGDALDQRLAARTWAAHAERTEAAYRRVIAEPAR